MNDCIHLMLPPNGSPIPEDRILYVNKLHSLVFVVVRYGAFVCNEGVNCSTISQHLSVTIVESDK